MSLAINPVGNTNYVRNSKPAQNNYKSSYLKNNNSTSQNLGFSGTSNSLPVLILVGLLGVITIESIIKNRPAKTLDSAKKAEQALPAGGETLAAKAKGILPENILAEVDKCLQENGDVFIKKAGEGLKTTCIK